MKWILFFFSSIAFAQPELQTVSLDLEQYVGKWYEIATIPQSFQKNCVATTATYTKRKDGDIDIINQCRFKTLDGTLKTAHGKAWVPDAQEPGKLKVRFFWPFSGKYWVLKVGPKYEYAVVGHPNRKYLWILSRKTTLDETIYEKLCQELKVQGYDLSTVKKTLQPAQADTP